MRTPRWGLVEEVSEFGYSRIAEREHPRALRYIESATAEDLHTETAKALNLTDFAVTREIGAIESIRDIYSGSLSAKQKVNGRIQQWELYRKSLESQILGFAAVKAKILNTKAPKKPKLSRQERKYAKIVPAIHPEKKGKEFYPTRSEAYRKYMENHPDALKALELNRSQTGAILNFVNGKRSITTIRNYVMAETDRDGSLESVAAYLDIMKAIDWIDY